MVVTFFILEIMQTIVKNVLTDPDLLLVNTYEGILKGMKHLFRIIGATCVKLTLAVRIAHVSLEKSPVIMTTY